MTPITSRMCSRTSGGMVSGKIADRIGWRQIEQRENHKADRQKRWNDCQNASNEVAGHILFLGMRSEVSGGSDKSERGEIYLAPLWSILVLD